MKKAICSLMLLAGFVCIVMAASPPKAGAEAPDFSLETLHGGSVTLSELTTQSPVVLVVLRGYPGYQCPYCNRQAQDFLQHADAFAEAGVPVVLVYPGPGDNLKQRAEEFSKNKMLPENFHLALDPGYKFTNLYGLRWDAPNETAYPATFLIDKGGEVFFAKISSSHGDRTKATEVLAELKKRKAGS